MILSSVSIENGEFHTAQHFKAPHFQPLVGFVSALNMYHLCTAPYRAAFCICLVFQSSNQSTQFFNWPDSILLQGNLPTDRCACAQENTDLHKSQINNKNRIKCVCFLYPEDDSKKADIRLFKVRWWKVVFQSSCIQIWLKKEKKRYSMFWNVQITSIKGGKTHQGFQTSFFSNVWALTSTPEVLCIATYRAICNIRIFKAAYLAFIC